jgi:outer membrane lipoprotein LolB
MKQLFASLLLIGLLAGCAATRPAPVAIDQLPTHYTVSGRVAVKADGKGYPAAHFEWLHDGEQDRVDVSNPLGQIVARIELAPGKAHFFDRDGVMHDAADIETLTERELGWRLPAAGLRFWLLGLATPDSPAQWHTATDGRTLLQDGWHIRYPGDAQRAPPSLQLSRPNLDIRIVLSDWQLSPLP